MAPIKIHGERQHLTAHRQVPPDAIHHVCRDVLGLPEAKRFHRFIALDAEDLVHPDDKNGAYAIIEISMFEGHDKATKRRLLQRLTTTLADKVGVSAQDIEITLLETAKANWGIRGQTADELDLNYRVET